MDPYVSVEKFRGKPVVKVRIADDAKRFPLTKAGCLEAGRYIYFRFNGKVESWMNSSSVDFPQEVKRGCQLDVRELMSAGYQEMMDKADAPRKSVVRKIMEFMRWQQDFLKALTKDEFKAFYDLDQRIKAENTTSETK